MLSQPLLDDRLCLQLLPRSAYSARDPVQWPTLGVTLERQQGVHAIDSDRRQDFDTWPGTLALTPAGVEVFSESDAGGEYLLLRWHDEALQSVLPKTSGRVQRQGHGRALALAQQARRLLLEPTPDVLALEHCALQLLALQAVTDPGCSRPRPAQFARVLEQVAEQYGQPLSLAQLAASCGQHELRFLRDFTRAVGMTPHAWLIETRVQAARRAIDSSDLPLVSIALDAGFAHQSHMGSAFRKVLGLTPSQYRARRRAL